MSNVDREDIDQITRLACVEVDDDSLTELTEQIAQILSYFAQLDAVEAGHPTPREAYHTAISSAFRDDEVREHAPKLDPSTFAPAFEQRLFTVPRLQGMEDE